MINAERLQQDFAKRSSDPFVIENSLSQDGVAEVFILLATKQSLKMLVEHGSVVFFLDGMHEINYYENNQLLTINVRIGTRALPCVYLITNR